MEAILNPLPSSQLPPPYHCSLMDGLFIVQHKHRMRVNSAGRAVSCTCFRAHVCVCVHKYSNCVWARTSLHTSSILPATPKMCAMYQREVKQSQRNVSAISPLHIWVPQIFTAENAFTLSEIKHVVQPVSQQPLTQTNKDLYYRWSMWLLAFERSQSVLLWL